MMRSLLLHPVAHAAALGLALLSCSGWPGASVAPRSGAPAAPPSAAPAGPRLGTTRMIRGYFRSTTAAETMRLWTGPNDAPGWERLTKLVATLDGEPVYSMAASVINPAGVCRSSARGLDQLLLSFNRQPHGRGGAGILWYDAGRRRFALNYLQEDITEDPEEHLDCAAGRSMLPVGGPARPCLCPWQDSPAGPGALASSISGSPQGEAAGPILVSPESPRQPEQLPRDAPGP